MPDENLELLFQNHYINDSRQFNVRSDLSPSSLNFSLTAYNYLVPEVIL